MAEDPSTSAPEPDAGDTASWLVEELVARGAEAPAPAAEEEDWGGVATESPESPEPPDEVLDDGEEGFEGRADLASQVAELRRDLAKATVDLDRLSGGIRDEVGAELERRREEWSIEGTAAVAEAKAQSAGMEQRLLQQLRATAEKDRKQAVANLQATVAELRAEVAEAEKRLGAHFVDEVRSHTRALESRQGALNEALEAFASRMDRLEERLRGMSSDVQTTQETLAVLARYRRHDPASDDGEVTGLDLNAARFEDLRRIGLSATQATRILTHRDGMGGYDSVERLREVPGLPDKLFERIRPRTRV